MKEQKLLPYNIYNRSIIIGSLQIKFGHQPLKIPDRKRIPVFRICSPIELSSIFAADVCFPGSLCYIVCIDLKAGRQVMAIYDLSGLLDRYSGEFLVLEFNHLFVSSSIREEVWLLQRKNDSPLIDKIMQAAREFNIHDVAEDRDFETYSGGQKAIIACLLTLTLIRDRNIQGLKLLLNNIMDSISEENRFKLIRKFKEICPACEIKLFTEKNGKIQELL